jgi:hypothetical protein
MDMLPAIIKALKNHLVTEQLKQLETLTQNVDILTTNKSALQAGFFAFTAFSVLSLLTSHKLQYDETTLNKPLR